MEAPLKLLSLFSGCGGLDLGFHQAGFETALAYDKRSVSVGTWRENIGENAFVRDIWSLTLEDMDRDHGARFEPMGVIGGPPCQGFSLANRKGSVSDPRNALVGRFFDLALELHARKPLSFIVMENVAAVLGERGGGVIDVQKKKLEDAGFSAAAHVLDANDYGVAQHRRRLFLVAINRSLVQKNSWTPPQVERDPPTVRDLIHGLPDPVYYSRTARPGNFDTHPNHWCMVPKSPKFMSGELSQGYVSKRSFKTLSWDKPSYTVAYGNREVHVHPDCNRRLSVLEAMLLQGFPKTFVMSGSLSDQITQVSEAVPPPLARAVAASIIHTIAASSASSEGSYVGWAASQAS
ncbi:DNA cytosine methyltransferase [Devosia sp.]|uniref:DNA cytosine methyltransferase n=1 Tax=Devosia sp. TaxID=1871048 RepID=UPI00292CA9D1|nr:DNA cytosine methyltransferase [Devosia sp.]